MFRNRLTKVYRHLGKQAKRQGVSCYRVYDHDLPEFPLCIELYGPKLYVAEYKRRHGMTEEVHDDRGVELDPADLLCDRLWHCADHRRLGGKWPTSRWRDCAGDASDARGAVSGNPTDPT